MSCVSSSVNPNHLPHTPLCDRRFDVLLLLRAHGTSTTSVVLAANHNACQCQRLHIGRLHP